MKMLNGNFEVIPILQSTSRHLPIFMLFITVLDLAILSLVFLPFA